MSEKSKDIPDTVAQAKAAASSAIVVLPREKAKLKAQSSKPKSQNSKPETLNPKLKQES